MDGASGTIVLTPDSRLLTGDRGGVIFRVETSRWLRLNGSGAMIAKMIDGTRTCDQIIDELCTQHGLVRDIVAEWVTGFLSTLETKGYLGGGSGVPEPPDTRLDVLYLHVTGRCNFSCPYCYASAGPDGTDLDLDLCKTVIARAREIGAVKLAISGGEPLLRDDLESILEAARAAGLTTQLLTNGSLLTPGRAASLTPHCDLVQLSVDGPDDETNSRTRGTGAYQRIREAVSALHEIGYENLVGAVTPYALTDDEIGATLVMAEELKFKMLRFNQLIPAGQAAGLDAGRFTGSVQDLAAVAYGEYHRLQQERSKAGQPWELGLKVAGDPANEVVSMTRKLSCGVGISALSIACDGTVYPCAALHRPELALGNVHDEDLGAIHERSVSRHLRYVADELEGCRDCDVRHFCAGGCRAVTYALTGSMDGPSPNCGQLKDRIYDIFRRFTG